MNAEMWLYVGKKVLWVKILTLILSEQVCETGGVVDSPSPQFCQKLTFSLARVRPITRQASLVNSIEMVANNSRSQYNSIGQ